ncbi:lysophospholipase [Clostridia bacterium]|nr:lysophospholipase [Clostridia bacterium]
MVEHFTVKTREKVALHVDVYHPKMDPRATLLVLHGMAEHKGRYKELCTYLADRGFKVYIYDQRGCGETQVLDFPKGMIAYQHGWELLEEDANQMLGLIHARHDDLPQFLLGHSMGSLLARSVASTKKEDLAGVILSGTPKNPGTMGAVGKRIAGLINFFGDKKKPSPFLSEMLFKNHNERFEPKRTSYDWLSRDDERVDDYVSDEYCGFICPPSFYYDLISGAQKAWRQKTCDHTSKNLPFLFLSGTDDPVGGYGQGVKEAKKAYQDAGVKRVTVQMYTGARHEVFNEINRKEVFQDVENWMDEAIIGWEG